MRRPPLPIVAGGALLLLLAGCSGTPFGDQLARSFPGGGTPPATPAPGAGSGSPPAATRPADRVAPAVPDPPDPIQPSQANPPERPAQAPKPRPALASANSDTLRPAPYRVTLRLPAADPSAPAEVMTEALRAAGVRFEVEMIERVRGGGGDSSGAGTPAPVTVTPAPAPR